MLESKGISKFAEELIGKVVVADTSSLLVSGVNLLSALPQCTLVIPAVVVQELESKRTHSSVGFLARDWLRLLENLRVNHGTQVRHGVHIDDFPHIKLIVEPNHSNQESLPKHLRDGSNDSTILAVGKNLQGELTDEKIVVLSNDTPLRLHATLDLEMEALEFNATLIAGAKPFDGRAIVELSEEDYLDSDMIVKNHGIAFEKLVKNNLPSGMASHEYVVVELDGNTKPIGQFLYKNGFLEELPRKQKASNIVGRTVEQDVAMSYLRVPADELPIVSIGGGAGSGKTLISMAVGLEELKYGNYQRMIVFRSLHEMGQGQELGFLPGDVNEKMEAWAGAVYDSIDVIVAASKGRKTEANFAAEVKKVKEMVEVSPITFLRGRSLSNSYIILDEAQNFSRSELLNILSRVGEGTKLVMIGDADQVDNRFLQAGAKADVWSVIESLKSSELFAHLTLKKTERSKVAELSAKLLSNG